MDSTGGQKLRSYVHAPLDLSRPCIRTISIKPGAVDSPIRCVIKNTTLSQPYRALSYTWGSPSTNQILLNDSPFTVRDNLYAFLVQARILGIEDEIFIDAICIDQANTAERNHQVRHMAQIYRGAVLVYLWPFDSQFSAQTKTSDGGWPTSVTKISSAEAGAANELCKKMTLLCRAQGPEHEHSILDSLTSVDWHRLILLCKVPYWTRLWVCQEVILARKVYVLYGPYTIDWDGLGKVAEHALDLALGSGIPLMAKEAPWSRLANFRKAASLPSLTLLDLIRRLGPLNCDDIRDRVYGLLGLASDGEGIVVDYTECENILCIRLFALYRDFHTNLWEELRAYLDIPVLNAQMLISKFIAPNQECHTASGTKDRQVNLLASFGPWDVYRLVSNGPQVTADYPFRTALSWNCRRCNQAMNRPQNAEWLFEWREASQEAETVTLRCGELFSGALPPDLIMVENKYQSWDLFRNLHELCLECKEHARRQEKQRQAQHQGRKMLVRELAASERAEFRDAQDDLAYIIHLIIGRLDLVCRQQDYGLSRSRSRAQAHLQGTTMLQDIQRETLMEKGLSLEDLRLVDAPQQLGISMAQTAHGEEDARAGVERLTRAENFLYWERKKLRVLETCLISVRECQSLEELSEIGARFPDFSSHGTLHRLGLAIRSRQIAEDTQGSANTRHSLSLRRDENSRSHAYYPLQHGERFSRKIVDARRPTSSCQTIHEYVVRAWNGVKKRAAKLA